MRDTAPNLACLKEDFPIFKQRMHGAPLVYLDTAATAEKPNCVIDTLYDFYHNHYGTVHRAVYELSTFATDQYNNVREKVRALLNAQSTDEIIFTKGTTESINLVASSFGKAFLQHGDEIVLTEIEHHSNIVPWQLACQERGAKLVIAPVNDLGELDLEAFKKLLGPKTKLVSIAHVSNVLGTIHPLLKIIPLCREVGAKVMIDGAQGAPHIPVDVQELDIDFYAFSGHKLYGPTGIGILYGKKALLEQMPPYQGGGDMIETVTFEKTTYHALPLKFEAGTPPFAQVIGLGSAIDYVLSIGLDVIHQTEKSLLEHVEEEMRKIAGLKIIGESPGKAGISSFVVSGVHALDIGTMLDLKGIAIRTGHHCSQPTMKRFNVPATARVSFGLYNTHTDVERFLSSLKEVISLLR